PIADAKAGEVEQSGVEDNSLGISDFRNGFRHHVILCFTFLVCKKIVSQSSGSCASAGAVSAKRTPTPIRRTGLPVRLNASPRSTRKSVSVGAKPARS